MSDTTIRISKQTHHKLKVLASIEDTTLNNIIDNLVNNAIEEDDILRQLFNKGLE